MSSSSVWEGFEHPTLDNIGAPNWYVFDGQGRATSCGNILRKPCKRHAGQKHYNAFNECEARDQWDQDRALHSDVVTYRYVTSVHDQPITQSHGPRGNAVDQAAVRSPRHLAHRAEELDRLRGGQLYPRVLFTGRFQPAGAPYPLDVRRHVDRAHPRGLLAYWDLTERRTRTSGETSVADKTVKLSWISSGKLHERIDSTGGHRTQMWFNAGDGELALPVLGGATRNHLIDELLEWMRTAETEAHLFARADPEHPARTMIEVGDPWWALDERTHLVADIDYTTTGFRPRHLRTIGRLPLLLPPDADRDTINRRPKAQPDAIGVRRPGSSGFTVSDADAGAGAAAWRVTKTTGGWEVLVRGTRGDLHALNVADDVHDADVAAALADPLHDVFTRRIQRRSHEAYARRAGTTEEHLLLTSGWDYTAEQQRTNRIDFIVGLIVEGNALSARLRIGAQHGVANRDAAPGENAPDAPRGLGRLFGRRHR